MSHSASPNNGASISAVLAPRRFLVSVAAGAGVVHLRKETC
jgi:hypothetical protein